MMHPTTGWRKLAATSALMTGLLSMGTGCGAMKALANPKVAFAISEPTTMAVVVRRADVADKTAHEVERLLTETPTDEASEWLSTGTPDHESASKEMTELKSSELYAGGSRVLPAEVWAKHLRMVKGPTAAAPKVAAVAVAPPPEPPKVEEAPKKKSKSKPEAKAPKAKAEPPVVAHTETPATPPSAKYENVLSAIEPSLGTGWSRVISKKRELAQTVARRTEQEAARDRKGATDAEIDEAKKIIDELDRKVDALESEAKKLSDEWLAKVSEAAASASPSAREHTGPLLAALRAAVADASLSNSAATVGYPRAVSSLLDSTKVMAKVFVADIVEEKTGKRPNMSSLQPDVALEGTDVKLTINGLSSSDLGKLSMGDLTSETLRRTQAWVKRATRLLGTISTTQDLLDFEDKLLGAILEGFEKSGWKAPSIAPFGGPST
jgi:hypothetical protein